MPFIPPKPAAYKKNWERAGRWDKAKYGMVGREGTGKGKVTRVLEFHWCVRYYAEEKRNTSR
jgi:hypothetical protein